MLQRAIQLLIAPLVAAAGSLSADEPVLEHLPGIENGAPIPCQVYAPASKNQTEAGLVIHLYGSGGSHRLGHYNVGRPPYDLLRQLLAKRGYWLVVPGLGSKHWMNDEACLKVDSVIEAMVKRHNVDHRKVHLLGTSMGAGSSLIYQMRRPAKIRSLVAIFPMTDFPRWLEEKPIYRMVVERAHGITTKTRATGLNEISPLLHPEAFRNVPMMLIHGNRDAVVPPHHSRNFAAVLKKIGANVIYREAKGEMHRDEIARPYQQELADFLTRKDVKAEDRRR
ncbi:MAG: alpha/beta hydrolase family protein [Limisphaerales bacterium]